MIRRRRLRQTANSVADDPAIIPVGERYKLSDVKSGRAGDGVIYKDSAGRYVKLSSAGSTYRVCSDGYKWDSAARRSQRPSGVHPEAWSALPRKDEAQMPIAAQQSVATTCQALCPLGACGLFALPSARLSYEVDMLRPEDITDNSAAESETDSVDLAGPSPQRP